MKFWYLLYLPRLFYQDWSGKTFVIVEVRMDHIDPGRLTWLCLVCETPAAMKDELRLAVAIKTVFCAPFQQSHYNSGFTRMSSRGAVCMRAHQREGECFQPEDVVAKSWRWDASKGWGISLFLQNGWLLMCHSSRPVDVQEWYNKPSIKHHILQYKVLCADNTGVLDFIYCYFYPENRQDCLLFNHCVQKVTHEMLKKL